MLRGPSASYLVGLSAFVRLTQCLFLSGGLHQGTESLRLPLVGELKAAYSLLVSPQV